MHHWGWPRCCIKVDGWCEKLARACRLASLDPNSKHAPELFLLIIHSLYAQTPKGIKCPGALDTECKRGAGDGKCKKCQKSCASQSPAEKNTNLQPSSCFMAMSVFLWRLKSKRQAACMFCPENVIVQQLL